MHNNHGIPATPRSIYSRVRGIGARSLAATLVLLLLIPGSYAQQLDSDTASPATTQLNLPEQVELRVLITLVSEQLDMQIVYDDQLASKRITIKTPREVPTSSLRGLLESALQINQLALVEDDQPGWFRIVQADDLTRFAGSATSGPVDTTKALTAVTHVFKLSHADPQKVDATVKPFLTTPGGNSFIVEGQGLLVVTDYASNFKRIETLVDLLDKPGKDVDVEFVAIQHLAAGEAMQELRSIIQARRTAQGRTTPGDPVQIIEQARTNRLLLIGAPTDITQAVNLLASIDVPLGLETRSYRVATASAKRIDDLARNMIGEVSSRQSYHSVVDEVSGLLIVTTTPEVHDQVLLLVSDLDNELSSIQPVTRFYKLANATASEVLATISEIEGVGGIRADPYAAEIAGPDSSRAGASDVKTLESETALGNGSNRSAFASPSFAVETDRARVVVDPNTNTLIVVAEPAVQLVYQDLIERLDRRRPQVQIEITLVTLDTSGGFSLGVEYARSDESGKANTLTFSSFGLSEVDPATGSLDIIPGLGFNGTVISADIADVVVKALSSNGRSKVVSAPRILVNDNATGTLTSASDAPTTSINASTTVSTTSFAGFESAGTNIEVTPHISEGDHLSLEYNISLSSFGEGGSDGIPPPRQRSELSSEVTVPDGHTIIIGGLNSSNYSETIQKVPLLGDIPGLEYLFSNRSNNTSEATLFVFIRPVILRDDQFKDLKFLSKNALKLADLPSNDPESVPLMIH